jgi:AraC-like DNA-binding protein
MTGRYLADLVTLALGTDTEGRSFGEDRGLKAARLSAVLSAIDRRFFDPRFDLDRLAQQLGISRRYIQQLLEQTGRSFGEHVAERRLQQAFSLLRDPRCARLRIIDIALTVGFGDVSHFNRMFRRRFGQTPSAVRAERIELREL